MLTSKGKTSIFQGIVVDANYSVSQLESDFATNQAFVEYGLLKKTIKKSGLPEIDKSMERTIVEVGILNGLSKSEHLDKKENDSKKSDAEQPLKMAQANSKSSLTYFYKPKNTATNSKLTCLSNSSASNPVLKHNGTAFTVEANSSNDIKADENAPKNPFTIYR